MGVACTSRSRNTTTERNDWDDILAKELAKGGDKFPTDTRVTANERVHANKDGSAYP